MQPEKLIILDRDGVINFESEDYIKSPEEWIPIPGSLEAIALLKKAGFTIAIATNQSGIARGLYTFETLEHIHQKMQNLLATYGACIDYIAFCPHHPEKACGCRKPQPGMLNQIAQHYHLSSLKGVPMVGDRMFDIEAARATECMPILVETGKGKVTLLDHPELKEQLSVFTHLNAVAQYLVKL